MPHDFIFKILIAGDGGVGKTTLLNKYINDRFELGTKMTIGVDILQKIVKIDDQIECNLQLWDFGGQEHFRFLLDSFVMGANGALILFDLTKLKTFNSISEWVDIVRKYDPNLPAFLIGAKADLEEEISVKDDYALEQLDLFNLNQFIKVSSKTGLNVELSFEVLVRELIKRTGKEFLEKMKKKYDYFSSSLL